MANKSIPIEIVNAVVRDVKTGIKPDEVAQKYGVSRAAVYRWIRNSSARPGRSVQKIRYRANPEVHPLDWPENREIATRVLYRIVKEFPWVLLDLSRPIYDSKGFAKFRKQKKLARINR
jgi:hypothetical protein